MVAITRSWEGGGLICVINVLNKDARTPRGRQLRGDVVHWFAPHRQRGPGLSSGACGQDPGKGTWHGWGRIHSSRGSW